MSIESCCVYFGLSELQLTNRGNTRIDGETFVFGPQFKVERMFSIYYMCTNMTTREVAKIFRISQHTVCKWRKRASLLIREDENCYKIIEKIRLIDIEFIEKGKSF